MQRRNGTVNHRTLNVLETYTPPDKVPSVPQQLDYILEKHGRIFRGVHDGQGVRLARSSQSHTGRRVSRDYSSDDVIYRVEIVGSLEGRGAGHETEGIALEQFHQQPEAISLAQSSQKLISVAN